MLFVAGELFSFGCGGGAHAAVFIFCGLGVVVVVIVCWADQLKIDVAFLFWSEV